MINFAVLGGLLFPFNNQEAGEPGNNNLAPAIAAALHHGVDII